MNYNWKLLAVITGICAALIIIVGLTFTKSETKFNLTNDQIVNDLQTKWVLLSPQGQLWGFSYEQKIDIQVLEKKTTPEGTTVISIKLTALATIPPIQQETTLKEHSSTPITPTIPSKKETVVNEQKQTSVFVELNGVAKLYYEKIADRWYLTSVEGVTLLVKPK